jgi:hypothetical protein
LALHLHFLDLAHWTWKKNERNDFKADAPPHASTGI